MKLIKIYSLSDPRTGLPFYVGATSKNLEHRLYAHCFCFAKTDKPGMISRRKIFVKDMIKSGYKPTITLLQEVKKAEVDKLERYYYNLFTEDGYILLQSSVAFCYRQSQKTRNQFAVR
jgi:mRNA deadenylase 3'-5' endonuclease subunit Ccr4